MLKIGTLGKEQAIVSHSNSAVAMGSGSLEVFSTPSMLALMEKACCSSIKNSLDEGKTTVGVSATVKHTAPTALGMVVWCESELTEIDGRRLVFKATALDRTGIIGTAVLERVIVDAKPFLDKANAKRNARV